MVSTTRLKNMRNSNSIISPQEDCSENNQKYWRNNMKQPPRLSLDTDYRYRYDVGWVLPKTRVTVDFFPSSFLLVNFSGSNYQVKPTSHQQKHYQDTFHDFPQISLTKSSPSHRFGDMQHGSLALWITQVWQIWNVVTEEMDGSKVKFPDFIWRKLKWKDFHAFFQK